MRLMRMNVRLHDQKVVGHSCGEGQRLTWTERTWLGGTEKVMVEMTKQVGVETRGERPVGLACGHHDDGHLLTHLRADQSKGHWGRCILRKRGRWIKSTFGREKTRLVLLRPRTRSLTAWWIHNAYKKTTENCYTRWNNGEEPNLASVRLPTSKPSDNQISPQARESTLGASFVTPIFTSRPARLSCELHLRSAT